MELSLSFLAAGWVSQSLTKADDERALHSSHKGCTVTEVAAEALGEEWEGYVIQISVGNDKALP